MVGIFDFTGTPLPSLVEFPLCIHFPPPLPSFVLDGTLKDNELITVGEFDVRCIQCVSEDSFFS